LRHLSKREVLAGENTMSYVTLTCHILSEHAIIRTYSCRLKLSLLEGAILYIHCKCFVFYGGEFACCAMQQCKNILMAEDMKKFNSIQSTSPGT
jgi:hypothetical protein